MKCSQRRAGVRWCCLSDGNDRYSQATAADALDRARRADVMIFPVALGSARVRPLFAELATLTGGRSFHARDGAALADTLRTIARELRQQYLLGLHPHASLRSPARTNGGPLP